MNRMDHREKLTMTFYQEQLDAATVARRLGVSEGERMTGDSRTFAGELRPVLPWATTPACLSETGMMA